MLFSVAALALAAAPAFAVPVPAITPAPRHLADRDLGSIASSIASKVSSGEPGLSTWGASLSSKIHAEQPKATKRQISGIGSVGEVAVGGDLEERDIGEIFSSIGSKVSSGAPGLSTWGASLSSKISADQAKPTKRQLSGVSGVGSGAILPEDNSGSGSAVEDNSGSAEKRDIGHIVSSIGSKVSSGAEGLSTWGASLSSKIESERPTPTKRAVPFGAITAAPKVERDLGSIASSIGSKVSSGASNLSTWGQSVASDASSFASSGASSWASSASSELNSDSASSTSTSTSTSATSSATDGAEQDNTDSTGAAGPSRRVALGGAVGAALVGSFFLLA